MPTDAFSGFADSLICPARGCFAITPADSGELAEITRAIYVGTGGNIVLTPARGTGPVTFRNIPSGSILDLRVSAIAATGTTASDIVGLV